MGSGAETVALAVNYLNSKGAKLGMVNVRLFLPFDNAAFLAALPKSVKQIAVLDRTKERRRRRTAMLSVVNAIRALNLQVLK